jgi:hypothetical protein
MECRCSADPERELCRARVLIQRRKVRPHAVSSPILNAKVHALFNAMFTPFSTPFQACSHTVVTECHVALELGAEWLDLKAPHTY